MEQTLELEAVPEESRRRVEELLREGRGGELERLAARSVAIVSGKGGVGKTITAVNLALYYCQRGLRVALVDLDPLSDVASLLDLAESESALSAGRLEEAGLLSDFTLPLFRNLDLLFPAPKLGKGESLRLLEMIFHRFAPELNRAYDLVIFDLPAGSAYEENLAFLPFIKLLVLVTNPEPTAHAAAGAYLRRLFALYPGRDVRLWHNRFVPEAPPGFNPTDVAGNYNRNVPEEMRLDPGETARVADLAFVPEDPALNLLRGNPSARRNVQRFLLDALQYLLEQRLAGLAGESSLPRALVPLLVGYLCRHRRIEDPQEYLEGLGEYLSTLAGRPSEEPGAGAPAFSPEQRQAGLRLIQRVRQDPLRLALVRIIRHLEESLQHRGLPQGLTGAPADRALDHELGRLLVALNRLASRDRSLVNPGGVLLFYFALYKLFRSDTVVRLVNGLVPRRQQLPRPEGARPAAPDPQPDREGPRRPGPLPQAGPAAGPRGFPPGQHRGPGLQPGAPAVPRLRRRADARRLSKIADQLPARHGLRRPERGGRLPLPQQRGGLPPGGGEAARQPGRRLMIHSIPSSQAARMLLSDWRLVKRWLALIVERGGPLLPAPVPEPAVALAAPGGHPLASAGPGHPLPPPRGGRLPGIHDLLVQDPALVLRPHRQGGPARHPPLHGRGTPAVPGGGGDLPALPVHHDHPGPAAQAPLLRAHLPGGSPPGLHPQPAHPVDLPQ